MFVLTGAKFYETYQSVRWKFNKMLLKASTRSGSLRLLKFQKQFYTNQHFTGSSGKILGRRNRQPCLEFSFLNNDEQFQPLSHSVRPLSLFSTHNIRDSGNSGWKRYSYVILGNQSRSIFCGHHWEPCLTLAQISTLKGIATSNARFDNVGNYSPNPH